MAIPTNLITGFLGVGKTTAVIDLLKQKAPGSRWAVLVNEYGDVSIDGAMIDGDAPDGVTVRDVGGGCVCCTSAPMLPVAIHFLLLEARPERLIIETTGLGHPARLLDSLRRNYHGRLDVRATVGIVDPSDFARPDMRENRVFIDQIQMADVVVMNKLDTAPPDVVADFQKWANGLFPPKLLIAGTTHGHLDPAWLDLSASDERLPLYPEAHSHPSPNPLPPSGSVERGSTRLGERGLQTPPSLVGKGVGGLGSGPAPGRPVRYPSPPGVKPACCGWVFDPADAFDENKLLALLTGVTGVTRLKGVFHLADDDWETVNRTGTAVSVAPTSYRRDSRLEVFSDELNWDDFERELLGCLIINAPA